MSNRVPDTTKDWVSAPPPWRPSDMASKSGRVRVAHWVPCRHPRHAPRAWRIDTRRAAGGSDRGAGAAPWRKPQIDRRPQAPTSTGARDGPSPAQGETGEAHWPSGPEGPALGGGRWATLQRLRPPPSPTARTTAHECGWRSGGIAKPQRQLGAALGAGGSELSHPHGPSSTPDPSPSTAGGPGPSARSRAASCVKAARAQRASSAVAPAHHLSKAARAPRPRQPHGEPVPSRAGKNAVPSYATPVYRPTWRGLGDRAPRSRPGDRMRPVGWAPCPPGSATSRDPVPRIRRSKLRTRHCGARGWRGRRMPRAAEGAAGMAAPQPRATLRRMEVQAWRDHGLLRWACALLLLLPGQPGPRALTAAPCPQASLASLYSSSSAASQRSISASAACFAHSQSGASPARLRWW